MRRTKNCIRHRSEVYVPNVSVRLPQILQSFAYALSVENVAVLNRELGPQSFSVRDGLIATKGNRLKPVAVTLFDRHRDVNRLAGAALLERHAKHAWFGVMQLGYG